MHASDSSARGPSIRIVSINDVYSLEHLPSLRTLVKHAATVDPADVLLVVLAGDFVSPSMLSSLDSGRGMIDCMNAVPITHVIFGNHEDDIDIRELQARVREFHGTWLSTNVIGFDPPLPPCQILDVHGPGSRTIRVGLVGVVMDDRAVYRGAPFGGAKLLPPNQTVLCASEYLMGEADCACVIPLTHQAAQLDRELALAQTRTVFPVILGGHDHTVLIEPIAGSWIIKAGVDATRAAIIDLKWPAEAPAQGAPDLPETTIRLEDVSDYEEDHALRERVDEHMKAVRALEAATLFQLREGQMLSSEGTRAAQTSIGTLLCSKIRDALGAQAAIFNGGGIRARRSYEKRFTYGDLKAEVPFDNEMVAVNLPGHVLREAVRYSRRLAPVESGGFLQLDDRMLVDAQGELVSIDGQPLNPDHDYLTVLVRNFLDGMDHIEPLMLFARNNPSRIPPHGSGREVKVLLVEAFCRGLWSELGDFDQLDLNQDGNIDAEEIAEAIARATSEPASKITVELLLGVIDTNHDGVISREEDAAARLRFVAL